MLRWTLFLSLVSFGVGCGNVLLCAQESQTNAANSITNSIGSKMVLIPAGEFLMGSRDTPEELAKAYDAKPEWFTDEQPSHRVRITKPFYLGACEVTRGQFRQFVNDTDYTTDAEKGDPKGVVVGVEGKTKLSWRNIGFEQTEEHPVAGVSWNDATAFCQWLSRKEGNADRFRYAPAIGHLFGFRLARTK